jgi:hypothetical protein
MPTSVTLPTALRNAISALLEPLVAAAQQPGGVQLLLQSMGYRDALSAHAGLRHEIERLAGLAQDIANQEPESLDSWSGLAHLLGLANGLFTSVREIEHLVSDLYPAGQVRDLGRDLVEQLFTTHLRARHPGLFRVLGLLTLITPAETAPAQPMVVDGANVIRLARSGDRLHLERLGALLELALPKLSEHYLPNQVDTAADAHESARRLFPLLQLLAHTLGLRTRKDRFEVGPQVSPEPPLEVNDEHHHLDDDAVEEDVPQTPLPVNITPYLESGQPRLFVVLPGQAHDGVATPTRFALAMRLSSARHPGAARGLLVELLGQLAFTETRGGWSIALESEGRLPALVIGPDGVALTPGAPGGTAARAHLSVEREAQAGPSAFVLGASTGTRLEIGAVQFGADLRATGTDCVAALNLDARSGTLVIAPADADGFLSFFLPADGLRANFDLGLALSSDKGLTLRGSAGLETTVPVGLSLAGINLTHLHLALKARDEGVSAEASASLSAAIGPVRASVAGIGLHAALSFPASGCNLGVADLQLGFKRPSGVGLAIDAQGVLVGSGFLGYDAATDGYAGALQVSLRSGLRLSAYGLIATRLPGGRRGYSLLVFVTADGFKPIPLGMGFTLRAIGGMLGVHRTFDVAALRTTLREGRLGQILLPNGPLANAPDLLRTLNTVFPVREGSHLLSLSARITWFEPVLVRMDLSLTLELGVARRLLAMGRVSALLPSAENDLIRLNLDALGVLDFSQGTLEADALLTDSRIAHRFPVTGAAALRTRWTDASDEDGASRSLFALSVGGFNPRYAPPVGFPELERVSIALTRGKSPRIVCEAYLAITANTVQFGARASLYAEAMGFNIMGELGFDALISLAPPRFVVDLYAQVQLRRKSRNLFKIQLRGLLEGPLPLRLQAKARFEILWVDFTVRLNLQLADGDETALPAPVDLQQQLMQLLASPASWRAVAAGLPPHGVQLRAAGTPGQLVLDPLGQLVLEQQLVPLNTELDIDTFAGVRVRGARRFNVAASLDGRAGAPVRAAFAPARYFEMSDDEKLAAPAFRSFDAGVVLGDEAASYDAADAITMPLGYGPVFVVDGAPAAASASAVSASTASASAPRWQALSAGEVGAQLHNAPAALAPARRVGAARFRNRHVAPAVTVRAAS